VATIADELGGPLALLVVPWPPRCARRDHRGFTAPAAFPTVGSAGSLPLTHSARSPMGKINLQKVIVGGLVAGVVLNVVDYLLFGVVLKKDLPVMSTNTILWFVLMDFLYGIFLVWFYAAIRPRFGPGPR